MIVLQLGLAILPCLLIIYLIYRVDRYEREDILPLAGSFLLGMLIVLPLFEIQRYFYEIGWSHAETVGMALFSAFVVVSLSEETFKFLALRIYPYRQRFFNEPIDGVVYATMIGMGFAMLENILYAFQYELSTTLIRAVTAVPAHASFAAIMGYYVGKARFAQRGKLRKLLLGWGIPTGIHGLYDFFVLQQIEDWLIGFSLLILSLALYFSIRLVREQQRSPFRDTEAEAGEDAWSEET